MALDVKKPRESIKKPTYSNLQKRLLEYAVEQILNQNEVSGCYSYIKDTTNDSHFIEFGKAYSEKQKLKDKGKELYKSIVDSIRESHGTLTVDKLKEV